jgi:regulator of protease activity HflC (stomatin/prohibitin superfamily)
MSKGRIGGIAAAVLIVLAIISCALCLERIPTGYVGVVYSMNGGVQDEILTQGFHLVSPTKHVKEFTVGNEQLILSQDERDGSEVDESFLVSTADNANISISFQMSYRFLEDQVVDTYKKFRGMDGESIVNSRVRTVLKAKISEVTTNYTMMDIYSGDRGKINDELTEFLNKELSKEFGIEVIDASIIDVHPDEQLQKTIQDRVTAMQKKQQAEAEQETIRVQNETKLLEAQANADAQRIAAEGEAEANRIIASSLTSELIQMKEMEARLEHGWVTIQGASTVVTNP